MIETQYLLRRISTGVEIPLTPLVTVGRNTDNSLCVVEGALSRYHAKLMTEQDRVFVMDLGSTNGTFVNGRRLDANVKTPLTSGDRIRFDIEEFGFVAQPPVEAGKTVFRAPNRETVAAPPAGQTPATLAPEEMTVPFEPRPSAEINASSPAVAVNPPPKKPEEPLPDAQKAEAPARKQLPGSFLEPSGKATVFMDPKARAAAQRAAALPSLAPEDSPFLWIASGERADRKLTLTMSPQAGHVWTIGSGEDCDIRLPEEGVSGKHATLRHEHNRWQMTDDMSVNGTFVNEQRILRSYLADGDRVRFGPIDCVFRAPPPAGLPPDTAGRRWIKIGIIVAIAFAATLAAVYAFIKFASH